MATGCYRGISTLGDWTTSLYATPRGGTPAFSVAEQADLCSCWHAFRPSFLLLYECGNRLRWHWRPPVPRPCGRGGAARSAATGARLHFGEGNRHAGGAGLRRSFPLRTASLHRAAAVVFPGHVRIPARRARQRRALPPTLRRVQAGRRARHGRLYLDRADLRRTPPAGADLYPRVQRYPRQSQPAQRPHRAHGAARLCRMREILPGHDPLPGDRHTDPRESAHERSIRPRRSRASASRRIPHAKPCSSWVAARGRAGSIKPRSTPPRNGRMPCGSSISRDATASRRFATATSNCGITAYVAAFHHQMQEAYAAADFAVARSGAASLSELAFFRVAQPVDPLPSRRRGSPDFQRPNLRARRRGVFCSRKVKPPDRRWQRSCWMPWQARTSFPRWRQNARRLAPADAAVLVVEAIEKEPPAMSPARPPNHPLSLPTAIPAASTSSASPVPG